MLDRYAELPDMYLAKLTNDGKLVVIPVNPHVYRRISTAGLGQTEKGAVQELLRRVMNDFQHKMDCINWQSRAYL